MKKMFLSLAAIAFVAAGSLTVTSCGGDDSTTPPPPPPPVVSSGKMTWSGTDYKLDTTTTGVVINASNQMIAYNIGTEEEPLLATRWIVISHEGEGTEWQTAENAIWNQIFVPVDGTTAVYPHESEVHYLLLSEVVVGGEVVSNEDMETVTAFDIDFAVWDEDGEKINYTSSTTFPEGKVSLTFDGAMNGPLGFTVSSGKSNVANLKSFKSVKLTNGAVDFNNVQTVNNAKLVKISK